MKNIKDFLNENLYISEAKDTLLRDKVSLYMITGCDEILKYFNVSGLKSIVSNPDKDIQDCINTFNSRYCLNELSSRNENTLALLITAILNVPVDKQFNVNDWNNKAEVVESVISMLTNTGVINDTFKIANTAMGVDGDCKDHFKIEFGYKTYMLVLEFTA